jgi:hypothetical protein
MDKRIIMTCLECDEEVDCTGEFNEYIGDYGDYETVCPDVCPGCGAPADVAFYSDSDPDVREDFHSDG